jgi:hypothetical protein
MERQRPNIIRRVAVGGAKLGMALDVAFSGGAVMMPNKDSSRSNDPSPPNILFLNNPRPPLDTHLAQLSDPTPTLMPTPTPTEALPTPTPEPTVDSAVLNKVVSEMEARPNVFSQREVGDVQMYYQIYKAAGDKYGIDWYLLWLIHEAESTASTNPDAFNGRSYPSYGAMQLNTKYWGETFVNKAASGLEYLADLPQRHPDDWKQIAGGALYLREHIEKYLERGYKPDAALELALIAYNGSGGQRYEIYLYYKRIFK